MNLIGKKLDMIKLFKPSATKISILQIVMLFISGISMFYFNLNFYHMSLVILGYFIYGGIGFSMMLHRFYSHRSFEFRYHWMKVVFDFIAVTANRGSIVGWVYTHRSHHMHADTVEDPHSPYYNRWKVFFPHLMGYNKKFNKFIVKDLLNSKHKFIDDYYFLILLFNSLVLCLISIEFWVFFYLIPVSILHIMLVSFIYFGHDRNHKHINDNRFFGHMLFGEGWHDAHHRDTRNWDFRKTRYSVEPISILIKYIKQ